MPLYEYKCSKCDKTFEAMQKFSDPPLTKHEGCGGRVKKLLSAPAFQLKGTGWYATDYARSGSGAKRDAKDEGKDEGKSEKAAGSESESKADTKSETKTHNKASKKTETSSKSE